MHSANTPDTPHSPDFRPYLINLEPATVAALDRFARENGTNRSLLVRLLLRQALSGDLSLRLHSIMTQEE